jgi:hypothetical protein
MNENKAITIIRDSLNDKMVNKAVNEFGLSYRLLNDNERCQAMAMFVICGLRSIGLSVYGYEDRKMCITFWGIRFFVTVDS